MDWNVLNSGEMQALRAQSNNQAHLLPVVFSGDSSSFWWSFWSVLPLSELPLAYQRGDAVFLVMQSNTIWLQLLPLKVDQPPKLGAIIFSHWWHRYCTYNDYLSCFVFPHLLLVLLLHFYEDLKPLAGTNMPTPRKEGGWRYIFMALYMCFHCQGPTGRFGRHWNSNAPVPCAVLLQPRQHGRIIRR